MDEQSLFSIPSTEFISSAKRSRKTVREQPSSGLRRYEDEYAKRGYCLIGGVDEAGRGPIAGPVVAACVCLPANFSSDGINDSKKLTATQRNAAFDRISDDALHFGIGIADTDEIDQLNILRATHLAMQRAVSSLACTVEILLIDGLPVPRMAECDHVAIVGGDALSVSIAAASIVAKVTRDRLMCAYAESHPEYGFDRHKGYGSRDHLAALQQFGPCPIHRRSFSPVSEFFTETLY